MMHTHTDDQTPAVKVKLDPVAEAAEAAANAAAAAARKEMLSTIERSKEEILARMEKTDAAIASLEREIEEVGPSE